MPKKSGSTSRSRSRPAAKSDKAKSAAKSRSRARSKSAGGGGQQRTNAATPRRRPSHRRTKTAVASKAPESSSYVGSFKPYTPGTLSNGALLADAAMRPVYQRPVMGQSAMGGNRWRAWLGKSTMLMSLLAMLLAAAAVCAAYHYRKEISASIHTHP